MKVHPYSAVIRSRAIFEEFIDRLYRVRDTRNNALIMVTCRYPVAKEYIPLPITDHETLKIAFVVVTPPGSILELYIDSTWRPVNPYI